MKPLSGRGSRQWVVGLTVAAALAVVGLLLGLTQTARAAAASLDGSAKSISSSTVSPGSIVTYTITLSNDGATPVSSLLVTDALPDEVSYVPLSAHSVPEGAGIPSFDIPNYRNITFTVASVPGNSDVQLVFRALVGSKSLQKRCSPTRPCISGNGIRNDSQRLGRGGSTSVSRNQEPLGQPTHHREGSLASRGAPELTIRHPDFRASPWYP